MQSATRALERHGAEAANEPGHLVEAELFSVSLEGEPRAAAEIDQIVWVDPAHHEDQGMMGQFLVLGPDQVPAPMPMPDMDMGSHGGH